MELDELKKELNLKMTTSEQRTAVDFASLLKRDTTSILQKVKRSLWIELVFAICFTIGCLIATFAADVWAYKMYFGVFIFIGLAFVIVLSFLLKKTNSFTNSDMPVKANIFSMLCAVVLLHRPSLPVCHFYHALQ
jgi:bacteriorhodopsin